MFTLPEEAKIHPALLPAADAAGRNGAWVSLKNAHKLYVVVALDQGNAATVALTLEQATAIAGTSAKAVTATVPIWANQDTGASDTLVRQVDAASFTTSAAVKGKVVIFELLPQKILDMANGFDCIRVVTGASNAANITSALYVATPLRYQGDPPPSMVVD